MKLCQKPGTKLHQLRWRPSRRPPNPLCSAILRVGKPLPHTFESRKPLNQGGFLAQLQVLHQEPRPLPLLLSPPLFNELFPCTMPLLGEGFTWDARDRQNMEASASEPNYSLVLCCKTRRGGETRCTLRGADPQNPQLNASPGLRVLMRLPAPEGSPGPRAACAGKRTPTPLACKLGRESAP